MMKVKKVGEYLWQTKVMEFLSYSLVFLAPLFFINNSHLFSFGAPKMILIVGIVILITLFFLWRVLDEREISFRITYLHIISLFFVLILTLSSVFGVDSLNSFFGRWRDGVNLILLYSVVIFSFLIGSIVKRDKTFLPKILLVSFISSLCVLALSFNSFILMDIFNSQSTTLGNNSYAGAYLLFNVCFGMGLFLFYKKIWQKVFVLFGIFIIIFSPIFFNIDILLGKIGFLEIIHNPFLLFGLANGATVGLLVSFVVILSFLLIFSSKKLMKTVGVVFLFCTLSLAAFLSLELVNPTSSIHNIFVEKKGENRFVSWAIAENSFSERPLLGSGFNNFSYSYQKYFTSNILEEKNPEFYFNQPHNVFWEYSSNNGVLGIVSFLMLLLFAFISLFKQKENEENKSIRGLKISLIGALFGYFIQNLFGFDTPVTYLILFLVIGLAIGMSNKAWIITVYNKNKWIVKFLAILFIIFSFASMFLFVFLPAKELNDWGKTAIVENIKDRIMLRESMQGVSLFGGVSDSLFLAEKNYNLYKENFDKINDSNKVLFLKEIKSVINQLDKDIEKQPNDARAYIIASELLNMQIFLEGKVEEKTWNKSYDYTQKAIILNPKNPELYLLLTQTYTLKQDFKNSYLSIRQAIVTAPKYVKSYNYAKQILNIKPNDDLQKYVDNMEKKWIIE